MNAKTAKEETGPNDALVQLKSVLVEGEVLEASALQLRLFALTHRRILIAATSGRFIALRRKLFGGFDMTDFRWQDLTDAKLNVGMIAAEVTFRTSGTSDLASGATGPTTLTYGGLQRAQAEQVYRIAQGQEQAWREKRRIRDLEELRAKSGGVQFAPAGGVAAPAAAGGAPAQPSDPAARLQQAKQMLDAKLISDAEYEAIKARIISDV
jgi:hypothetical protein